MIEAPRTRAEDAREVGWRLLVAVGAGAIVGALVGGIGGRLAMLVLRLGSSDTLHGIETDDGFAIGRFTTSTFFLLTVTAGLGGVLGAAFFVVRGALPRRWRAGVWCLFFAVVMGAAVVNPDSFDFAALDPKPFAVAAFVLLPGLAALLSALAIERLLRVEPWSDRRLTVVLVVGSLPLVTVFPAVAALYGAAFALRRKPRLGNACTAVGRVVVPVALAVVAVRSGLELWSDAGEIL